MGPIDRITKLSPLPIVNLDDITPPQNGMVINAPAECKRLFTKSDACRLHYERLRDSANLSNKPVQCPYGFCSYAFRTKRMSLALTGIIPFPRLGGDSERLMAKKFPHAKLAAEAFRKADEFFRETETNLDSIETEAIDRQSVALHEIRKLNRTVKQTAERLCLEQSPFNPDLADASLVKIWKSAELMSAQFDVIELLGNEELFRLPLNTSIEIYKIFDKCVRIYRPLENPGRILLRAQPGYHATVLACDKTFHMIPTVLIENALKYSISDSVISIEITKKGMDCVVRVRNEYPDERLLTESIFERGVRLAKEKEGSGNGLYLAKLVAAQHNAFLKVSSRHLRQGACECAFTLIVPETDASMRSLYATNKLSEPSGASF